jgi:hypothetical protein
MDLRVDVDPTVFLTYHNSAYGIKIKYPPNLRFEYRINPVSDRGNRYS